MVSFQNVLALLWRELSRPQHAGALAVYLFASAAIEILLGSVSYVETTLRVLFLWFPLVLAPIAATLGGRDRVSGLSETLRTTPLSKWEDTAAKVLAVSILAGLFTLTSAVIAFFPLTAGIATLPRYLAFVPSGFFLGLSAGLLGLVVANLVPRDPRLAVGLSLGVVLAWVGLAAAGSWLFAAFPSAAGFWRAAVHLSPETWVWEALAIVPHGTVLASLVLGAALVLLLLAALCVATVTLQDLQGWRAGQKQPVIIAVVLSVLCAVTIFGWPQAPAPVEDAAHFYSTRVGENVLSLTVAGPADASLDLPIGTRAVATFDLRGAPGTTLTIEALQFRSSEVALRPLSSDPVVVTAGASGTGSASVPCEAHALTLDGATAQATALFTTDGKAIALQASVVASTDVGLSKVPGLSFVVSLTLLLAALVWQGSVRIDRRSNAW